MALPSTYKQLQWIGSTSARTQYINTGFKPKNNTRINLSINCLEHASWAFGCRYSYKARAFCISTNNNGNDSTVFYNYGGNYYAPSQIFTLNTFVNVDMNSNNLYKDGTLIQTAASASFTCEYNAFLFGCNDQGSFSGNAERIAWAKIYDNGTLVRDYVPAKRLSDGVVGLYDLQNNYFYTNAGSGTFEYAELVTLTAVANPVGGGTFTGTGDYATGSSVTLTAVPNGGYEFTNWTINGYTKLNYIMSDGTQYIDTKVSFTSSPTSPTEVEIKFNPTVVNGQFVPCGCENNGNTWNFALQIYNNNIRTYHASLSSWKSVSISANTDYVIKMTQNGTTFTRTINGTTVTGTTSFTGASRTFTTMADNTSNYGYNQFCKMKLYYLKIKNNGTLVRDYIPVIRHSDLHLGLLDLVNMKFYENTGTYLFTGANL